MAVLDGHGSCNVQGPTRVRGRSGRPGERSMLVGDCMTRNVIAVGPEESCARAHDLMQAAGIARLPVLDVGRLVGILTDGDLVRRVPYAPLASDRRESQSLIMPYVKVGGVMTYAPVTVIPGMVLDEAVTLMCARGINTLLVVDDESLVGVLTRRDTLSVCAP